MTTLEDILNATCEVYGLKKRNIASKKRIDEKHQTARIVYCIVSTSNGYRFAYSEIGRAINRTKQQVCYNIKKSDTPDKYYGIAAREVKKVLMM